MDATDLHYAYMLKKHCKYPYCEKCPFGKEFITIDHKSIFQCTICFPSIWTLPDKEKES